VRCDNKGKCVFYRIGVYSKWCGIAVKPPLKLKKTISRTPLVSSKIE
jgi:hypothetical protein